MNYNQFLTTVKKWKRENIFFLWYYFILGIQASLLHGMLMLLGFKKLIDLLHLFQNKNSREIHTITTDEVYHLRQIVYPMFSRVRDSRYFWTNCLSSSLLLWIILKKQNLEVSLVIGTKKEQNKFKAHAWIECENIPLNERMNIRTRYSVFQYDFSNKIYQNSKINNYEKRLF